MNNISEALKAELQKLASRRTFDDNEDDDGIRCVDDYAGGNVDDAFELGVSAGETRVTRQICDDLGIPYEVARG